VMQTLRMNSNALAIPHTDARTPHLPHRSTPEVQA
jgi:hypothetical protein